MLTDHSPAIDATSGDWPEIDTTVAHPARVYDYLQGGRANFAVDREAAEQAFGAMPGGVAGVRAEVRAGRAGLGRMVRFLASDAGLRQFLDIGTGIPSPGNTHEVAQAVAPESRVVYVDHDPMVLAFAHRLLTSGPEGTCAYVYGDLHDPGTILRKAAKTLDFGQPAAILLFNVLHFFPDTAEVEAVVGELTGALAPGGYLAIAHLGKETDTADETFDQLGRNMIRGVTLRTQAEVARLFDGLSLIDPGVAQVHEWRLEPGADGGPAARSTIGWCGIGRKS